MCEHRLNPSTYRCAECFAQYYDGVWGESMTAVKAYCEDRARYEQDHAVLMKCLHRRYGLGEPPFYDLPALPDVGLPGMRVWPKGMPS